MEQKLWNLIDGLIAVNIKAGLVEEMDQVYLRNRLLALFNENNYEVTEPTEKDQYEILEGLVEIALEKGLIEDQVPARDQFTSHIMDLLMDKPSEVNKKFFTYYEESPKQATDYFYELSKLSTYIKVRQLAKNKQFDVESIYGDIQITINLSKPEKDPKDIAKQKTMLSSTYPTCLLCIENEGFSGTSHLPDRANHRMIHLNLNHHDWMLQYSPYLYYNEHCILLSKTHEPMTLTKNSFYNLLSFVQAFPHYFIGSNADLPIVGGSILAHEHYQGGRYEFPIHRASVIDTFSIKTFPGVQCRLLKWPLSTISISGSSLEEVAECTHYIYEKWKVYSDSKVDILSHTGNVRHNTITPIARKKDNQFIMDIVLRNNRTNDEHPLGIFHPHTDVQHIKKENIGLIEVMGLAILPGRLQKELEDVKAYIKGTSNQVATYHLAWAEELKHSYDTTINIDRYIEHAVGQKFSRVLEDAGVFKMTSEGIMHFKQFIDTL